MRFWMNNQSDIKGTFKHVSGSRGMVRPDQIALLEAHMPQLNDYRYISHQSVALDSFRSRTVAARGTKTLQQARCAGRAYRQVAVSGVLLAAVLSVWMQSVLA
jgi:hypothetical protein